MIIYEFAELEKKKAKGKIFQGEKEFPQMYFDHFNVSIGIENSHSNWSGKNFLPVPQGLNHYYLVSF